MAAGRVAISCAGPRHRRWPASELVPSDCMHRRALEGSHAFRRSDSEVGGDALCALPLARIRGAPRKRGSRVRVATPLSCSTRLRGHQLPKNVAQSERIPRTRTLLLLLVTMCRAVVLIVSIVLAECPLTPIASDREKEGLAARRQPVPGGRRIFGGCAGATACSPVQAVGCGEAIQSA
jgi:hypothetical protein